MDNEPTRHGILESILQHSSAKPRALPLQELKEVTNNFSEDRQIGKGGFGIVYKGLLPNGEAVAVKDLISSQFQFQEKQFKCEVDNLMKVQHKNIVRCLGYCYESSREYMEYKDTHVFAESSKMLLCFEYVSNGSLDKHINDASCGFDWHKRYRIIKGICHGLHYLHEKCQAHGSVIHLDLKPENILLDDNMVPKIADFGISKFFSDQKLETCATSAIGSRGYMAPEYYWSKTVSKMADIYSLGVIIMQIITGCRVDEISCEDILESVLENWRKRMESKTSIMDCEQIRTCLQISIQCMAFKKEDRPSIKEILQKLYTLEDKETYKELRETAREETKEETVVGIVDRMAAVALDVVRATSGFPRWWNAMAVKLEKLRACLLDLSSHPSCVANNKAVCHEVLQLVADTLTEVTDLAGRCTEDSWEKVNPSTMGAVAVKVDVSLSDCKLLVKIGKLYDDTSSLPPLDDTSTCVDIRELQRLSAWLEMSHMEAKIHALDGLLEAMRKDEKSVVSMLDHCDNVSDMVQLLSVSWPEVIREKATMVVCHVAPGSNGWLLESEVGLRLLVRQAKSGNVMDCQKAAVVLHHLSSTSCSTARVIVSHFGICPLIEMCRRIHNGGGDSVSQSSAAGMLKNVFMAMDFRRSVDNHRSVRVMVDLLLESADDAVPDESKEHAVECLKDFTSRENDDELRRAVVSEGGLRALLLYYLGDNDHRHEAAVSAIRNLVGVISSSRWWWASDTTTTMKRLAGEQGCVPLLVRTMVKHESKDAREVAVQMLACLATYPPNAMEMDADDKCVPALLHLLDLSPNTNAANKHANQCLRPNATVTLHHLSSTSRSTACSIVSHGGVGPLIKMCRQKGIDSVCQSAAAGILKNISAVPELQQSLEDHGIVHVIGQLLDPRHAHNAANKQAIQYLLSLASSKRCRNLMISHGAIEHLRKLSDMDVEGATELLHRLEGGWLKGLFSSSKQ